MKNILILIILVLFSIGLSAQTPDYSEYNRWMIGLEIGNHLVSDKSATSVSDFPSFGGDIRYNINPKLSVGLSAGTNLIDLEDFNGNPVDLTYTRVNLEAYINAFQMLDIYSPRWAMLFHGGVGLSHINTDNDYKQGTPNLRGGVSLHYRVFSRVFLKADMSAMGNYNMDKTIDGAFPNSNTGVNTIVANATIGIGIALGKRDKHMDNYIPVPVVPVINKYYDIDTTYMDTTVNIYNSECDITTTQFVYFDNDKFNIKDTQLDGISTTKVNLANNPEYRVLVKGYASDSKDVTMAVDSETYNMRLSRNRAHEVKKKLILMGVVADRIDIEFYGKDKQLPNEMVFDAARRVELIIIK